MSVKDEVKTEASTTVTPMVASTENTDASDTETEADMVCMCMYACVFWFMCVIAGC